MACALNGGLKQRAGYSLLYSLNGLVITLCLTNTDMGDSLIDHDCLDICKVQIDQSRNIDQIGNALNSLLKNLICLLKSIRHCGAAVNDLQETVIWNHDQRIHCLL